MQIFLNGEPQDAAENTTVAELLAGREIDPRRVAVDIDMELIPREQHAARTLRAGERVEIVTLFGGG